MQTKQYNRNAAVTYARKWAFGRNRIYYDFENIGGDCTNFASQCIFAGSGVMNYTPVTGWYYRSINDRSAAWSSVEYLFKFLTSNKSAGPLGYVVPMSEAMPGDIVQLGRSDGSFYHTPVITSITPQILVAAHTYDALDRPLSSYSYDKIRFIHIDSVRAW